TIRSIVEGSVRGEKEKTGHSAVLIDSLGLGRREMISLVGAGGKTTLMFRLAKELIHEGKKVITTTTTKILEPSSEESPCLFIGSENEKIKEFVKKHLCRYQHVTVAQERVEPKKLKGISSDFVTELWNLRLSQYLIVEADGAAGHPVKAPRLGEPVISPSTTLVVALLGVDGVGLELREENIFRAELVSRLTGIPLGGRMTDEGMGMLITHPHGIFRGAPASSRVVVFLNKVDIPHGMEKAKKIAKKVLAQGHCQIERIVLGQLKKDPPVVEVCFRDHQS
ncbi:MAG TPA: selenium cofactor biosynthesis protein YqeC, partial [Thermodesulfobacteriota bacterium]|nr:selenium cofactor biosynthesis protein YqeC [Thermodesulfobacteriota bacterium]